MVGDGQFDHTKGMLVSSTDVLRMNVVYALLLQPLGDFVIGDD